MNLENYKIASSICHSVFDMLKKSIVKKNITNIKVLHDMGMQEINDKCSSLSNKKKGVAYPVSVSTNHIIDNFIYDPNNLDFSIQNNDVVKIKLGVDIDGCIVMHGDTFVYKVNDEKVTVETEQENEYVTFLNKLKSNVVKKIRKGNTNDEVRIYIESHCTMNKCFPVINCKSFEHFNDQIYNDDGKYMILNYKKQYDKNEYLVMENDCFEFLENEIYTINLSIVPDDSNDIIKNLTKRDMYYNQSMSLLHRLSDNYVGLKLKSSRMLFSTIFAKHNYNVFNLQDYKKDIKLKLGIKECMDNKVLNHLPVCFTGSLMPVYSATFTICVNKKESTIL